MSKLAGYKMTKRPSESYFTVCEPIRTVTGALEWKDKKWETLSTVSPLNSRTVACIPGIAVPCHELQKLQPNIDIDVWLKHKSVPRTIVCHDLNGGYQEDRFVRGSSKHDEYRFFHWAAVDIFVYLSYSFITIPPVCWINSAHLHGVKVLGTLMTDGDEGAQIWNIILEERQTADALVTSMVNICKYFGFDGYYVHIANVIPADKIQKLLCFLKMLKLKLELCVSNSSLIWYDSIISSGEFKSQNELNSLNKEFFDICDGILVSYNWTEESLLTSVENAHERRLDVYVGIDVFGRTCRDGGFDTYKAVEVARKYGLSVAIGSPGWTYEKLGPNNFLTNEYLFWKKLWKYLYVHGPVKLPFSTSFCQGYGKRLYIRGLVFGDSPWYNLSMQQYQPSVAVCVNDNVLSNLKNGKNESENSSDNFSESGCIRNYVEDAFIGGGCLKISKALLKDNTPALKSFHRILISNFLAKGFVLVTRVTKNESVEDNTFLNLVIGFSDSKRTYSKKVLADVDEQKEICLTPEEENILRPVSMQALLKKGISAEKLTLGEIFIPEREGWKVRYYVLNFSKGGLILDISAELFGHGHNILLGLLRLCSVSFRF